MRNVKSQSSFGLGILLFQVSMLMNVQYGIPTRNVSYIMVEIRINATFLNCESTQNALLAFCGRELRFPTAPKFLSRFGDRSYRGNVELFL